MINQYDNVRAHGTCPRCHGRKDKGLVLCWPCHHKEKGRNDGAYHPRTERAIASWDFQLGLRGMITNDHR